MVQPLDSITRVRVIEFVGRERGCPADLKNSKINYFKIDTTKYRRLELDKLLNDNNSMMEIMGKLNWNANGICIGKT